MRSPRRWSVKELHEGTQAVILIHLAQRWWIQKKFQRPAQGRDNTCCKHPYPITKSLTTVPIVSCPEATILQNSLIFKLAPGLSIWSWSILNRPLWPSKSLLAPNNARDWTRSCSAPLNPSLALLLSCLCQHDREIKVYPLSWNMSVRDGS